MGKGDAGTQGQNRTDEWTERERGEDKDSNTQGVIK